MIPSLRQLREQLEQQLRTDLMLSEQQLKEATPERHEEALHRYEAALDQYSDLIVHRQAPKESRETKSSDRSAAAGV